MAERRDTTQVIRTPEGVAFSLVLAGPMTRFLAWLIDCLCIWALLGIAGALFKALSAISSEVGLVFYILVSFVVSIGYAIGLEWFNNGQTFGKKLLRLRVMDRSGLKLQFGQVVVRNLLRTVDSLPYFYLVGGIACLFNRNFQRLGDLAAHTIVVRNPKVSVPDIDQLFPDKYNSFRAYPHLIARFRQHISASDAALGLEALLRRSQLEAQARIDLFKQLAGYYRTIVAFPAEATEGLSDERYVRNLVDVVYRPDNELI